MVGPDSHPSTKSPGGHHHSGLTGRRMQVFHSGTPSHRWGGGKEQTTGTPEPRVVNHTVDSCKAHTHVHLGPILFLPRSAGHSESYGQVRVKDGTGEPECLEPFATSKCTSIHRELRLPELCGACMDLSRLDTVAVHEDTVTRLGWQTTPHFLIDCFRCLSGKSRPEARSQPSARMYLNLNLGCSF